MLDYVIKNVTKYINRKNFKKFFDWFIYKFDLNDKFEKLEKNRKNKLPSKAKAEQITCKDKSRLVYKIGKMTSEFMDRIEKRLLKNLDID